MDLESELTMQTEKILRHGNQYDKLISNWISTVEATSMSTKQKQQKILELHHLAALIMSMEDQGLISDSGAVELTDLAEEPDFILWYAGKKVGLELRRILNDQAELIGMQRGMLRKAEAIFVKEHPGINLLVNVEFKDDYVWEKGSIEKVKKEISDYIYCLYSEMPADMPEYLAWVRSSTHTGLNFELCGAYWVGSLDHQKIADEVKAKEAKLDTYLDKNKDVAEMWLLLIISGASPESDFTLPSFEGLELQSRFGQVFLLNDFKKQVYQLK